MWMEGIQPHRTDFMTSLIHRTDFMASLIGMKASKITW
jgi:hypothetical protein